jgi:hypothetical protein
MLLDSPTLSDIHAVQFEARASLLGNRLMAGQRILIPFIKVRILVPQLVDSGY